jgi:hypothetical protein
MLAGCPPLDEPMDVNGTANGAVVEWKRRWEDNDSARATRANIVSAFNNRYE